MKNPNLDLLLKIAHRLRPLLDEVVFVGGCTTALLITDPGAEAIRPTYDVDVIVEITSYADYTVFSERLRTLGFQEDSSEGAPLCRWQWEQTKLDVMPLDENVLGFSNRWYRETMTKAEPVRLDPKTVIRAITAPYFLATKLEAFHGRGRGDVFASHDLEDVIAVIDGRPTITEEIQAADASIHTFISRTIASLLADRRFLDALPGYLLPDTANQRRLGQLKSTLETISSNKEL
jgi:hypothetical protein